MAAFFNPRERARAAAGAKLRYVCCGDAGIRRVKRGRGFVYYLPSGKPVTAAREIERIRKLAIPPAWTKVWICLQPQGHLQATGIDARGRKQYRYDARWRKARDEVKYHDLLAFAEQLPKLRQRLATDRAGQALSREQVLATVVSLMAETGARVGNDRYRVENGSFGLTTLLDRHAKFTGKGLVLAFRGKGGKPYRALVSDERLSRLVRRCRDIPGQRLFQYLDADGARRWVGSADVNRYLQQLGGERLTAKTFRTWIASVSALVELRAQQPVAASPTGRKRQVNEALTRVAERLGNTPTICRKSYVHPALIDAFLESALPARRHGGRRSLSSEELDLVAVLEQLDCAQLAA
jgi:DNA topoisomerase-1